jgi:hypothetical protein
MKNPDQLEGKVPAEFVPQKYPGGEMSGEVDYTEGADVTAQHAAIAREHPEPGFAGKVEESVHTFPLWLLILCGVAIFWAGGYLFLFSGAFSSKVYDELRWEPGMLFPASKGEVAGSARTWRDLLQAELRDLPSGDRPGCPRPVSASRGF